MNQMTRRVFGAAGFSLLLAASASFAQTPTLVRVRGTVETIDGPMLTVKSRDGQTTYKVRMADSVAVRGIVKATLSDIKDNSLSASPACRRPTAARRRWKSTSFPKRCAAPGKATGRGIWCRTAP